MKRSYEEALAVYNQAKESGDIYAVKPTYFDLADTAFDRESQIVIIRGPKLRPIFHDPELFFFFVLKEGYPGFVDESDKTSWESHSLVEINKSEFDEYVQNYLNELKPEQKPTFPDGIKFYEVKQPELLQRDFIMETKGHESESPGEFILIHWHTTA